MGQAAVDLPDPLEPPDVSDEANASATATAAPAPAPIAGADDLLSQLAGEEIDRLLAEADAETARAPLPAAASAATVTHAPVEPVPQAPVVDNAQQPAQIGDVLDSAAKPAGSGVSSAERELESLLAEPPQPGKTIAELHTSADESAALLGDEAADEDSPAGAAASDDGRAPALVRVLEFLNAPAAALSDGARDAIGKLAILTFFNSVAVLLYVLLFRK